ncbi:hypothetical protein CAPTEDRAFT_179570 [Capitella teleta]|uniref:STAS domain-containing protein n=1 Tax=Capitella teleta TaxID=283909 RepID=R7TDP8_CAPTE|nr:hypothetical protein CAPTEDRAFT_179570 [Capitella teleta]|eukprot:ELT89622.1 hypothetical protein CAPTEDRAFT_179570 [Capitella teleta]
MSDLKEEPTPPPSEVTDPLVVKYEGLTQAEFDEKYDRVKVEPQTLAASIRKSCSCSKECVTQTVLSRFPVVNAIRTYKKEYILGDIVSGLSVGVTTVPQSMGYALLAQVPAIMGLYTSFFPVVLYCLFSSSRHVAIGTMALSSLVIASSVQTGTAHLQELVDEDFNNTQLVEELNQEKISIAVSVTMMSGLILMLMSLLKLSFIVTYIGEQFISGFLTGANLRVLTHQVKLMLGVTTKPRVGVLSWVYMVWDILYNIPTANWMSIVIAALSMFSLIFVKYFINERFKAKLPVPLPIDLVVVIITTLASYYGNLNEDYGLDIVSYIPKGVPEPTLPNVKYMVEYIPDAFALAILGYLLMYMMAILFSKRHNYPCDPDQELFACGIANAFGGFFGCIGASSSPPRCFVMELTGGQTQLAYFISGIIIFIFMLFLAPLLEALPICVLASIIFVACIPLFEQYKMCVTYWRTNKYDFSIWLVTAAVTLTTTIDIGMAAGIIYSFIVTVYKTQRPNSGSLVPADNNALVDSALYANLEKRPQGVRIFTFDGPLYFATCDTFKEKLFKAVQSPSELTESKQAVFLKKDISNSQEMKPMNGNSTPKDENDVTSPLTPASNNTHSEEAPHAIIIDCSKITYTDTPGAKLFAGVYSEYDQVGVRICYAACTEDVKQQLTRVPICSEILNNALYPSIYDALIICGKSPNPDSQNVMSV